MQYWTRGKVGLFENMNKIRHSFEKLLYSIFYRKLFNKNMGLILKQYMPIQFIYVT